MTIRAISGGPSSQADVAYQAVRDMLALGFSDYAVAQATRLSVEAVRQMTARREART